jgi:hypothetical protein
MSKDSGIWGLSEHGMESRVSESLDGTWDKNNFSTDEYNR